MQGKLKKVHKYHAKQKWNFLQGTVKKVIIILNFRFLFPDLHVKNRIRGHINLKLSSISMQVLQIDIEKSKTC